MHPNQQLIVQFFQCFVGGDYKGMQKCLHSDVEFTDIGFDLRGKQVSAMWQMICEKGIRVMYRNPLADDREGSVEWECNYDFKKEETSTPRPVHNVITTRFRFENGLIREQHDTCDFHQWAQQALGIITPILELFGNITFHKDLIHEKVRAAAKQKIDAFIVLHADYS